jgi:3-oxoacyl-[acyl-carrier protein] reductase
MGFADKVVLVTGAGRGIGLEIARRFAAERARIVLNDVEENSLMERARELESAGAVVCAVRANVSRAAEVRSMLSEVKDRFGGLDVLVNNAAIFSSTRLLELEDEEWDRVMSVNVKGVLHCSQESVRLMREGKGGRIVNLSSLAGKRGRTIFGKPGESTWAAYAVSKASIIALTKAMAFEWAPHRIHVNAVAPSFIDLGQAGEQEKTRISNTVPVGRVGWPSDVAAAVLFLASEENGYITGEILDVNGGLEMD